MGNPRKSSKLARPAFVVLMLWSAWQQSRVAANPPEWNYENDDENGPSNWHETYPDCGGVMQSPINIDTSKVLFDSSLQPFDISDYSTTDGVHMKLENVGGHTAEVIFSGRHLFLQGGSLPAKYELEQLHFHWGDNDTYGSEHSTNGQFYPMELHMVHRQERFPNVGVAAPSPHGLAVLSFFIKFGKTNPHYDLLIEHLQYISDPDNEVELPPFPVAGLIPKEFDYYRYEGSLTTPPCYESVIWSVSLQPIVISRAQLKKFRSIYKEGHQKLVNDFRPIQSLNHRTVLVSRKPRVWNFPG